MPSVDRVISLDSSVFTLLVALLVKIGEDQHLERRNQMGNRFILLSTATHPHRKSKHTCYTSPCTAVQTFKVHMRLSDTAVGAVDRFTTSTWRKIPMKVKVN